MIKKIILRALFSSFFRSIVGATFIVSGIIKGNDSIGFSYKLEEYFQDGALAYRIHEIFGWNSFPKCSRRLTLSNLLSAKSTPHRASIYAAKSADVESPWATATSDGSIGYS